MSCESRALPRRDWRCRPPPRAVSHAQALNQSFINSERDRLRELLQSAAAAGQLLQGGEAMLPFFRPPGAPAPNDEAFEERDGVIIVEE